MPLCSGYKAHSHTLLQIIIVVVALLPKTGDLDV
jgi:hypothetical protein